MGSDSTAGQARPFPGDFGLAKGGGWAMAVVRWGTGVPRLKHGRFVRRAAKYGHAAVCVGWTEHPNGTQEPLIVEATPGGVVKRTVPPSHFDWADGRAGLAAPLTDEQRLQIVRAAEALLGRRYDWPNIGRFLLRWAWPSASAAEDRDRPDNSVICSELVVWCYRRAGVVIMPLSAPGNVSPNDLQIYLPRA